MTEQTDPVPAKEPSGAEKQFGDFAPGLVGLTDDVPYTEQLTTTWAWPGRTASPGPS
jgi:hypothetical protein